jgi:hypothetical protein
MTALNSSLESIFISKSVLKFRRQVSNKAQKLQIHDDNINL